MPTFDEDNFQIASVGAPGNYSEFRVGGATGGRQVFKIPDTSLLLPSSHTLALTTFAQTWTAIQTFEREVYLDLNTGVSANPALRIRTNTDQVGHAVIVATPLTGTQFAINENGHVVDNAFTVCDNVDTTKRFHFQVEGVSSGSDRTITVPNSDGTLALIDFSQGWTTKQNFLSTIEVADTAGDAPGMLFEPGEMTLRHASSPTLVSWLDTDTGFRSSLIPLATTGFRTWNLPDLSIIIAGSAVALTSGRIPFASTGGILTDDADLTFATDTLTATKVVGSTSVKVGTAAGYISSDGSTGATGSFTTVDSKTVTVKDGIITSIV